MTDETQQNKSGPEASRPDRAFFSRNIVKRLLVNRIATGVVTSGGWIIIGSILAILFVIVGEFYPLFKEPTLTLDRELKTRSVPLAVGIDPYQEKAYAVEKDGIRFYSLLGKKFISQPEIPEWNSAQVTGVFASQKDFLVLGLSDGRIYPMQIEFRPIYDSESRRTIEPFLLVEDAFQIFNNTELDSLIIEKYYVKK